METVENTTFFYALHLCQTSVDLFKTTFQRLCFRLMHDAVVLVADVCMYGVSSEAIRSVSVADLNTDCRFCLFDWILHKYSSLWFIIYLLGFNGEIRCPAWEELQTRQVKKCQETLTPPNVRTFLDWIWTEKVSTFGAVFKFPKRWLNTNWQVWHWKF